MLSSFDETVEDVDSWTGSLLIIETNPESLLAELFGEGRMNLAVELADSWIDLRLSDEKEVVDCVFWF